MIKIVRLNEQTTIDRCDKFKGQSRPVLSVDHWVLINSLGADQLLVSACRRLCALRFDFNRTFCFVRYFQTPVKMFSFIWSLCECSSSIKACYKDELRLVSFSLQVQLSEDATDSRFSCCQWPQVTQITQTTQWGAVCQDDCQKEQ